MAVQHGSTEMGMRMYKVMIADDNEMTRVSLRDSIAWEEIDCELAGEALDGLEAYELYLNTEPEIVILDIRMPGRDGLETAALIRQHNEQAKIIIITGYNDFTYAQTGVHIGVFEFLLKPIDNMELIEAIKRAQKVIDREQKVSYVKQQLQKKSEELEKKQFIDYMNGCFTGEEKKRECSRYAVMVIRQLTEEAEGEVREKSGHSEFLSAQRRTADQLELYNGIRIIDLWQDSCVVFLLLFYRVYAEREFNLELLRLANRVYDTNKMEYGFSSAIGISKSYREYRNMPQAYEEACMALSSRFFLENRHVIHVETIQSRSVSNEYMVMKQLEELYHAVGQKEGDVKKHLDSVFAWIREDENYDVEYVRNLLIHICITVKRLVNKDNPVDSGSNFNELIKEINSMGTLSAALEYVEAFICSQCMERGGEGTSLSPSARKIMDYLKRNYRNKITLQEVADHLGVSSGQICRIIKADTGETLVTLLNKIRIQAAMQMLREGNYKVYEVAQLCGFTNYAYFYQLFRKETGKSPKNFY